MLVRPVEASTADLPGLPTVQGGGSGPATGTEELLAGVLADVVGVERVSVTANFFDDLGADSMLMARFCARVRKSGDLPSVSMKDVYRNPTVRGLAAALAPAPAPDAAAPDAGSDSDTRAALRTRLAEALSAVLGVEQVSVDAHVFDDLGADSMVMARFCARVRKSGDLPSVSMKDVYRTPTVRGLAAALVPDATPSAPVPAVAPPPPASAPPSTPAPAFAPPAAPGPGAGGATLELPRPASRREHLLCGTLQLLVFLGYTFLAAEVLVVGYDWIVAVPGAVDHYLRSVVVGTAVFVGMVILPVLAKWLLVGRWKPGDIRIWSLGYVRFWLVKTLVRANPMVRFVGSPLYVLYLRALGARIGRDVVIFSRTVPVCTDLLTVGDGTVIRKDVAFACYRAYAGVIQLGPVTLGRDVVVSEATVLDIGAAMGDGAQLGHRSTLHAGQAVPAGERWHGSPAQPTDVDYRGVEPADCGRRRRLVYPLLQLVAVLGVYVPVSTGLLTLFLDFVPGIAALLDPGPFAGTDPVFYRDVAALSLVLFIGRALMGLVVTMTVPRVLHRALVPDRVYPLFGLHYAVHRTIARLSNSRFWIYVVSDSSFVVGYLRRLGYSLDPVEQTGSNFSGVVHETPFLVSVGTGTMVADGLSVNNAEYSSTSFRVSRAAIGPRNFLGNAIAYPSGARTGDNCLLATKVMVPIDGPVREGVGLLGSPAFEIPRSVLRDSSFQHLERGDELRRRLAAKDRHNLHTIGLLLLTRWFNVLVVSLITLAGFDLHDRWGALPVAVASLLSLVFTLSWTLFVERAATGFRPMTPRFVSIYDPYFWWHERHWKLVSNSGRLFAGTPFAGVFWRLAGARVGRRLFDDGVSMPERSLVTIGDDCTLNAGISIQCHSQEDGAFKLDGIRIGSGVTIGVGSWIHYGTTLGDGCVIEADSFLMKGEEVPPGARWGGNPAGELGSGTDGYRPAPAVAAPSGRSRPYVGRHRARRSIGDRGAGSRRRRLVGGHGGRAPAPGVHPAREAAADRRRSW